MAPTAWKDLPVEVILKICELLYHEHYSSLVNFARSEKAHYTIAITFLARTLRIFGDDAKTLALSVQEHVKRLHRDKAFKHVRHLAISSPGSTTVGHMRPFFKSLGFTTSREGYDSIRPRSRDEYWYLPPPARDVDYDSRFENLGTIERLAPVEQQIGRVDEDWHPLADLIKRLPRLTDLIYHCPRLIPPCLLQALHEHQPRCRLHIDDFRLHNSATQPPFVDPHEFMVVTSPCLYSITLQLRRYSPSDHDPPEVDIISTTQRILSRLAPNLKEVHLRGDPRCIWGPSEIDYPLHIFWKHLDIHQPPREAPGSLSCLQLYAPLDGAIPAQDLANWSMHTDFATLQTLKFDDSIGMDALDYLVSASHGFPSLERLHFILKTPQELEEADSASRYYQLVRQFISRLRGLRELGITWWHRDIDLGTILAPELQTLLLRSCRDGHPTARDVTEIRKRCPFLTELTLTVLRSKGDANETAVYRELGALPRLQQLSLEMDARLPPPVLDGYLPPDPSFDKYDREPFINYHRETSFFKCYLNGHYRDAFINGAMDENLALDIFRTISRAKPNHSIPLQKLVIRFDTLSGYESPGLGKYGCEFHRPWQVERCLRDDSHEPLVAQELDKQTRLKSRATQDNSETSSLRPNWNNRDAIFRRIWPERSEGSKWREDWQSYPLSPSTFT